MSKKSLKILGINPGTRYLGLAFLQESDLREWRIKTIYGSWSKEKMARIKTILLDFIEQYDPNILAIKKLHPKRCSSNLKYLQSRIKQLAKNKGLRIYQYSINDLEDFFLQNEKKNKKELAKFLSSEYSELMHDFKREKLIKNPYYFRMFEAVALASKCFYQLDN